MTPNTPLQGMGTIAHIQHDYGALLPQVHIISGIVAICGVSLSESVAQVYPRTHGQGPSVKKIHQI